MMTQRMITTQTVDLSPDVDLYEDRDRIIEGIRLALNNSAETAGHEQKALRVEVEVTDDGIDFYGPGVQVATRRASITVESILA